MVEVAGMRDLLRGGHSNLVAQPEDARAGTAHFRHTERVKATRCVVCILHHVAERSLSADEWHMTPSSMHAA